MITGFFPGRIRLRAPVFKDTAITQRALSILKAPALSSIIKEIEHNPVTGSVLIKYHPTKVPIAKLTPLLPFFKKLGTLFAVILWASPSVIAVFPTPAPPT